MESSTYMTIEQRIKGPVLEAAEHQDESHTVDYDNYTYIWVIPSVVLFIIAIVLVIMCIWRKNSSLRQELQVDSSTQRNPADTDWRDNLAYERTLQRSAHEQNQHVLTKVEVANTPQENHSLGAAAKSHKTRPIGMATRIPHTEDSNATDEKYCQLPAIVSMDKTQPELLKQIKKIPQNQRMVSATHVSANERSVNENPRQTTDYSQSMPSTLQRLKHCSSLRLLVDNKTPLPSDVVEANGEEYKTKSLTHHFDQYQTLDSTYSDTLRSSGHRYRGTESEATITGSRTRKRTPRMSDAGTQWAIENHLTRRKSSFKPRFPSLRYPRISKKHANCVSLNDLPEELRESVSSLDSTATHRPSMSSHGSPYKLQIRSSMRPGRKILYRNGTRKSDRSVLRKSKKWTKNFEMSVVEESPSFYMSFDSPLPPSTDDNIPKPLKAIGKKLVEETSSVASDHNYEEIRDSGGYQPMP